MTTSELELQRKTGYLNQIRQTTIHPTLRLSIELISLLAVILVVISIFMLAMDGHPWLALLDVSYLALAYVLRKLAILLVDVADMLAEQAVKKQPEPDNSDEPKSSLSTAPSA